MLNRKQFELPLLVAECVKEKKILKIAHYCRKLANPERQNLPQSRKETIQ